MSECTGNPHVCAHQDPAGLCSELRALRAQLAAETAKADRLLREVMELQGLANEGRKWRVENERANAAERAHAETRQKLEAAERDYEKLRKGGCPCAERGEGYCVCMVGNFTARRQTLEAELSSTRQRLEQVEGALRFQDPRNAAARYDRIADDFERETGLWPPGRSRPAAMGADPQRETSHARWRDYCNEWHEKFFDAALHGTTKPER